MENGSRRILTTHVGSLPRPPELIDFLLARERVTANAAESVCGTPEFFGC
jgi:methionine synthase II (cobalamin-independent)